MEGIVTVILTWTKDHEEEDLPPAPKWVGIDVTGEARATFAGQDSSSSVIATMGEKKGEGGDPHIVTWEDDDYQPGNGYIPKYWWREAYAGGSYFRVKPVPDGATRVEFEVPLKAKVVSSAGNTEESNSSGVIVNHHFNGGITARSKPKLVVISSDIEKSYKKGTGALPADYKRLGSNGQPLYESQQVAGVGTTTVDDDVWKLECIRNGGSPMDIEGLAVYGRDKSNGELLNEQWYGASISSAKLRANDLGFVTPEYQWTLDGGTPRGGSAPVLTDQFGRRSPDLQEIKIGARSRGTDIDNYYMEGIELGGTSSSGPSVKSSLFSVKVFETDPGSASIILDSEYKINWHSPLESVAVSRVEGNWYVCQGEPKRFIAAI